MENLNFEQVYVICTNCGFVSNFRLVFHQGKTGFSYDLDWDESDRSYFSAQDARSIQRSLKNPAAIQDESLKVKNLQEAFLSGDCSLHQVKSIYHPCTLMA